MKTKFDAFMAFLIQQANPPRVSRTLAYREAMIDGWILGVVNYSTIRTICSAPVPASAALNRYAAYADHIETASTVDTRCLPSVA